MNQEDDEDFRVWEDMEWWQHHGLGEEVDRLEEALNNKRIRMHLGVDKLRRGYFPKGSFTMKEAYDLWTRDDTKPMDQKWQKLWKEKIWPKLSIFS